VNVASRVRLLGTSANAELVGRVRLEDVHRGLVQALSDRLRGGIPAFRLHNQAFLVGSRGIAAVVKRDADRVRLQAKRTQLAHVRTSAERAYFECTVASARARCQAAFEEACRDLDRVDAELAELERAAADTGPDPGPSFAVDGDVLADAMKALIIDGRKATRAQSEALKIVVPALEIRRNDDGTLSGYATVRLPIADGVAELGPITWRVRDMARGTAALRGASPVPEGVVVPPRDELVSGLVASGLTRNAAFVVANCPLPELGQVLLHRDDLSRLPAWVAGDWRQSAFVAHVTDTYVHRADDLPGGGRYSSASPERQAVVDLIAAAGGRLPRRELQQQYPRLNEGLWQMGAQQTGRKGYRTPWPQPFEIENIGWRENDLVAVGCPCGGYATWVLRVPEVPTCLACRCGRIALDPEGHYASLRLPAGYRGLVVSEAAWRAAVGERRPRDSAEQTAAHAKAAYDYLATRDLATTSQIAERLGVTTHRARQILVDDPRFESTDQIIGGNHLGWHLREPAEVKSPGVV